MTNRTVIQLADYGGPYSGNFIASLLALEIVLKKAGFRQVLIFSDIAKDKAWLDELRNKNISIYLLPKTASPFYLAKRIANIAMIENAVILHTHFTTFDVAIILAQYKMKYAGKRIDVFWHEHSNFLIEQTVFRKIKDFLKFRLFGRSVSIVAVSEEIGRSLEQRGFSRSVYIIHNGIDIAKATTIRKSRREMRAALNIPEHVKLLLAFGWEPITKGIDILFKAAEGLYGQEDFIVLIIGENKLRNFVTNQYGGIIPSWLRISEPREDVAEFYGATDIFISTSRSEGFSYAVGEAMANGLPVISSNIAALNWAHNAQGVILYDTYDTYELGQKIKEVINWSPQKIQSIAESNHEFISTKFSLNSWTLNIYNIYEKILKDSK